jgi:hypothetical protein
MVFPCQTFRYRVASLGSSNYWCHTSFFPVQSSHRLFEQLTTPWSLGCYNKLRQGRRHPSEAVPLWYFHASPFVIEFRSSVRRITAVARVWPVQSSNWLLERLTSPLTRGSYNKLRQGRRHPSGAVPLWYFHASPFLIEMPQSVRRITGATRVFSRYIIDQTVRTIDYATDPGELQ